MCVCLSFWSGNLWLYWMMLAFKGQEQKYHLSFPTLGSGSDHNSDQVKAINEEKQMNENEYALKQTCWLKIVME